MFGLKLIKAVAVVHRGSIALAIRELGIRHKLNNRRYDKAHQMADDLEVLAANTKRKAGEVRHDANNNYSATNRKLLAAENVILNAKDDLTKLTSNI